MEFPLNQQTVHLCQNYDAICVFINDTIDSFVVDKLKTLKVKCIALRCAEFNNVALSGCSENGIAVVNVPSYSPHAVAEYTMGLLLCWNRKLHKAYNRIREGNFSLAGLGGFDLYQKPVGLIGMGQIGQCFAQFCHGFGMKILAHDPEPTLKSSQSLPFKYTELNELFSSSDIISLNCPLTNNNFHLIEAKRIQNMKDKVTLLNAG